MYSLTDGEELRFEAINSAGVVVIELTVIAKEATILNTLTLSSNPITGLDAECSQIDGDNWVLYTDQDFEELSIFPFVSYADGSKRNVSVDNMSCFMYGVDDVDNDFPGNTYEILIKYFLGKDETSTVNEELDGSRFINLTKTLYIDVRDKYSFSKISAIPLWWVENSVYVLRFIGYHENRTGLTDVTSVVEYVTGMEFNNSLYNIQQQIQIVVPYTDEAGDTVSFNQTIYLTITDPSSTEPFLIRTTAAGVGYGSENALYNRPQIRYSSDNENYYIPSTFFNDVDQFLFNFYEAATPPWLTASETEAPTPTHFTIRDSMSLATLVTTPIAIDDFATAFTLPYVTTPGEHVGSTVIVEFLLEVSDEYSILYGVPVEVLSA